MKPKLSSRTKKLQENVNVNVIGQPPVTPIFVGTRWGEGVLPKDDMVCTYNRHGRVWSYLSTKHTFETML